GGLPPQMDGLILLYAIGGGAAASVPIIYFVSRMRVRRLPQKSELDIVMEIIRMHSGVIYQSQIVRESGLSKSTVSTILKVLESQGRIVRVREGRENLVRLTR
ncbi:MAG: MarR family transcriptional regulator, partial [candidate division WOR-3 bacterium]